MSSVPDTRSTAVSGGPAGAAAPGATAGAGGTARRGLAGWPALRRLAAPVLSPTRQSMRALALASIIANAVIMSTGAAVRLSSSGLGCPDWPKCTVTSLAAAHTAGQTTLNTWIEFGNRLLNFPLVAIAGLAFIAALRYRPAGRRRRDLVWLAAALPGGVIAQAVLGGIVVLTKLNPALVSAHFLLSCSVTGAAVLLHAKCAGEGPLRPVVRADLRLIAALLGCVTVLMILAGTVVTGTGPLAGNATAHRYHLPLGGVTQLHADIGWFMGALLAALVIGLWFATVPRRVVRKAVIVLAGIGAQGVIGYIQYFTHLPAGLVWVHVSAAVVLMILVLQLLLSMYEYSPAGASAASAADLAGTVPAGRRRLGARSRLNIRFARFTRPTPLAGRPARARWRRLATARLARRRDLRRQPARNARFGAFDHWRDEAGRCLYRVWGKIASVLRRYVAPKRGTRRSVAARVQNDYRYK